MGNNINIIERLEEEMASGESSLDKAMRVYGVLKDFDKKLYEEFGTAYDKYNDDEIDEVDSELLKRVYESMGRAPEVKEGDSVADLLNDL